MVIVGLSGLKLDGGICMTGQTYDCCASILEQTLKAGHFHAVKFCCPNIRIVTHQKHKVKRGKKIKN